MTTKIIGCSRCHKMTRHQLHYLGVKEFNNKAHVMVKAICEDCLTNAIHKHENHSGIRKILALSIEEYYNLIIKK